LIVFLLRLYICKNRHPYNLHCVGAWWRR